MRKASLYTSSMACHMIPFPQELRPHLPTIVGNVDYLTLRQRLEQIDALLQESGLERRFLERALQPFPAALEVWKEAQRGAM